MSVINTDEKLSLPLFMVFSLRLEKQRCGRIKKEKEKALLKDRTRRHERNRERERD